MDYINKPTLRMKLLVGLFLIFLTLTAYWQLKNNGFIDNFDDNAYVMANGQVQQGFSPRAIIWAFTTTHVANWHPLTWLSLMLDYQLYGLNPRGYHLTSLLFHLANTLLLFLILESMTRVLWASAFVAALFALHPLHVESVAWVAERKDVLSTFFWIVTMWAYLWYTRRPGWGRYWLILLSFTMGLMAKPMLVTLPFVLLLLDYWPLGRLQLPQAPASNSGKGGKNTYQKFKALQLIWEKVPLLILASLSCLLTIYSQKSAIASLEEIPFSLRLGNAIMACVGYLGKMLWPLHLAAFYPHPQATLPWWQIAATGLALVGVSSLVVRQAPRYPYLLVGWFWYLGTLVPVIGLIQVGSQAIADRYTYVPLIGIFIILAWGASDLTARWRHRELWLRVAAGVLLSILMTLTWYQVGYWRDSKSLFEHALKVTKNNYTAYCILINKYEQLGMIDEAIKMFQNAIEIKPDVSLAYNNYGMLLARQHKIDEAIPMFKKAIQFSKDFAMPYNNLGMAYDHKGMVIEAVALYKKAIEIDPDCSDAYNNLGIDYANQGKDREAIAMFQKAIQHGAKSEAYNNLGLALAKQGDLDQAITMLEKAVKVNPNNAGARELLLNFKARRDGH